MCSPSPLARGLFCPSLFRHTTIVCSVDIEKKLRSFSRAVIRMNLDKVIHKKWRDSVDTDTEKKFQDRNRDQ